MALPFQPDASAARTPHPAELAAEAQAERVADLFLLFETAPLHAFIGFRLTPLAIGGRDSPARPVVAVLIGDRRQTFTPDEARLFAGCLTHGEPGRHTTMMASLFISAASDAEAMARGMA